MKQHIDLNDGAWIDFWQPFYPKEEADRLFSEFRHGGQLLWQQESGKVFGKSYLQPRLTAWVGEYDYKYSGVVHPAAPWIPILLPVKDDLERAAEHQFNGCLFNLYRDGNDSVDWHADDGFVGPIASLSLGAERDFQFRCNADKSRMTIVLGNGDLLVMGGTSQETYKHKLPKRAKVAEERINLTFRLKK